MFKRKVRLPKPIISKDRGTIKILKQTGKTPNLKVDKTKSARLPGKRISRTGKIYWETRKNRSDAPFKNI